MVSGPPPIPQSDLKRQYAEISAELHAAVDRVFASGWFILGPEVEAFEREFAAYHQVSHAVGVANGTEAIHLALRAMGVGPGDEVLIPDNTAFPTAVGVTSCGATPVFVDVDPLTSNLDPAAIEARVTSRTKAVVPVHLYGFPADLDPILALCERLGLALVEDACQAHGTGYKGRRVGTFGRMGCFSFYPSKNLGAYGDGGAILTNDAGLAEKLRMLRNYGQTRRYYHATTGINSRLDELQAAMLRVKLGRLDGWIEKRRRLACKYHGALAGLPVEIPLMPPIGFHTYHLFVVRCPERDRLAQHLAGRGIGTLIHYPVPLHLQEAFTPMGHKAGDFPVTERLAGQILSLPLFPEMADEELERVANAVREFYARP
ncbi:MAG: DegT/DnrJ/EryC1/StrS family aminotransferase [Candidatus Wallbacteria bacterium]|nr:DegT/DnrJ/EryC1/StrS family aminotransferase [Candidatus Wallbacteria bacterium]